MKSAYKHICQDQYGSLVNADRCAFLHTTIMPHFIFDNFDHPVKPWVSRWNLRRWLNDNGINQFNAEHLYYAFNDYFDVERQIMITLGLKAFGVFLAVIGGYCYSKEIILPKYGLISACFVINMILHIPNLYLI